MAHLKQVVVDCTTPSELARFWAAALDDFGIRAYDDAAISRLVALGATVKERFEAHAWMLDPEGNDFCVVDAEAN